MSGLKKAKPKYQDSRVLYRLPSVMDGLASTGTCITWGRKTKAIKRELSVFYGKALPNTKYLQYK